MDPDAATALGVNFGFSSWTFWFDRIASTTPISTTNKVESPATANDLGCDAVGQEAWLITYERMILYTRKWALDVRETCTLPRSNLTDLIIIANREHFAIRRCRYAGDKVGMTRPLRILIFGAREGEDSSICQSCNEGALWGSGCESCDSFRWSLMQGIALKSQREDSKTRRTCRTRAGLSPTLLSKIFRSPDSDRETISSPCVQVFPTCWNSTAVPSVQVVTAFLLSTSPSEAIREKLIIRRWDKCYLQIFTARSAEDVTKDLLSELQLRAIYSSKSA